MEECNLERCTKRKGDTGLCPVYSEEGVETFNRMGVCGFQKNITPEKKGKLRIGQQKTKSKGH